MIARRHWLLALSLVLRATPSGADDDELPCAAPLPTVEAVGQCLGASVFNGGPWSILATTPSARLVRAGNERGPTVFVVALRAGGWAAVDEVEYEQGNSQRHGELRAGTASETTVGAHVVARFDVHVDDEIVGNAQLRGDPDARKTTTIARERSVFCVIGGRCVSVMTSCQAALTVENADYETVKQQHGRFTGRVQLGADGVVTLATVKLQDKAQLCDLADEAKSPQRLWSEPPAPADTPRWTAPRLCTVTAARAHFVDAMDATALRAYVVKGDRVEVTPRAESDRDYVVARYHGTKTLTVGLLEAKSLDCKTTSP